MVRFVSARNNHAYSKIKSVNISFIFNYTSVEKKNIFLLNLTETEK